MKRIAILVVVLFAIGGGVATAGTLITSGQIKNGTIKTVDMSSSAKRALKGNTGPRGAQGSPGPQGPQGAPGPSAVGGMTVVKGPQVPFGPSDIVKSAAAFCPAGQRVVSGGGVSISDQELAATEPIPDRSGWFVIGIDLTDNGGEYVQATAVCAPTGVAVAARSTHAEAMRKIERLTARIAAQR